MTVKQQIRFAKLGVHALLCLPLAWLVYLSVNSLLGVDPAEKLVKELGFYSITILWLCLSMTPLKRLTGLPHWIAIRRAVGLWCFAYVTLHLLVFLLFWAGLQKSIIVEEISQRPYIMVGMAAWLLLIPLAVTSLNGLRRWMGSSRWQSLHRLIYPIAILALLHLVWLSKLDFMEPLIFFVVLILLFYVRFRRSGK